MGAALHMSAIGPKRTCAGALHMSAFGGKADMIVCGSPLSRSLLGAKRTSFSALHMSALDPKRTWRIALHMSAFGAKAVIPICPVSKQIKHDITQTCCRVGLRSNWETVTAIYTISARALLVM